MTRPRLAGFEVTTEVLAVLPSQGDRNSLLGIFNHTNWNVVFANTFEEARAALLATPVGVVFTECRLSDSHGWKNLLKLAERMPDPPPVIVTDRLADERLWAEVLNLGGYDVLMKPFDATEVFRVVSLAWLWWKNESARRTAIRKDPRSADSVRARRQLPAAGA